MATISPTGRRATGWGAQILNTALIFKTGKEKRKLEREKLEVTKQYYSAFGRRVDLEEKRYADTKEVERQLAVAKTRGLEVETDRLQLELNALRGMDDEEFARTAFYKQYHAESQAALNAARERSMTQQSIIELLGQQMQASKFQLDQQKTILGGMGKLSSGDIRIPPGSMMLAYNRVLKGENVDEVARDINATWKDAQNEAKQQVLEAEKRKEDSTTRQAESASKLRTGEAKFLIEEKEITDPATWKDMLTSRRHGKPIADVKMMNIPKKLLGIDSLCSDEVLAISREQAKRYGPKFVAEWDAAPFPWETKAVEDEVGRKPGKKETSGGFEY